MAAESLRLTASLRALPPAARYSAGLARAAGLSTHDAYRLRLALDELITNIVTHAYHEDGSGEIELVGRAGNGTVVVEITDWSPPFDPVPDPPADPGGLPSVEEGRLGGYGLTLARQASDRLEYERVGGQNRTTVVVRRTTGPC